MNRPRRNEVNIPIETEDILIRIPETGEQDFIYTIRSAGTVVHCGVVRVAEEVLDDAYYGGSQVMD
jgi:hypothetical protein